VKKPITFNDVRKLAEGLEGVEVGTTYGTPALKVRGKMFACIASHSSAEPDTLAVRMGFAERDELIAADSETYYLKDHYLDYPIALVRLRRVHPDALRDLLKSAWRFTSATTRAPRKSAKSTRRHSSHRR
jgi:hypothetical protein